MAAQYPPQPNLFLQIQAGEADRLVVAMIDIGVAENVRQSSGHTGAKVDTDWTQHHGDSRGHVFATVLADSFHYSQSPTVPDGEAFSRLSRDIELAGGRPVQHRVPHQYVAAFGCLRTGTDGDRSTAKALSYVVVCLSR